jgi:hypothetical protein
VVQQEFLQEQPAIPKIQAGKSRELPPKKEKAGNDSKEEKSNSQVCGFDYFSSYIKGKIKV